MERLGDFKDSANESLEKKEQLEQKVETLDEHVHKILEERDNYILEKLNKLQGNAADKVKSELDEHARRKVDMMNESQKEIDETEEMLSSKLRILDSQIGERKDAQIKIEQLGTDAQIDVSGSIADISAEIEEMNNIRENILEKLKVKAKTSGRAIVI
jgi:hypothetical protein